MALSLLRHRLEEVGSPKLEILELVERSVGLCDLKMEHQCLCYSLFVEYLLIYELKTGLRMMGFLAAIAVAEDGPGSSPRFTAAFVGCFVV